jgi:glycosyltransferase involved in cell wall biosynthesis
MADPIADALIIVLDDGASLHRRRALGSLPRDCALWKALAEPYRRLLLVTHGGPEDLEVAPDLWPEAGIVCNDQRLPTHFYASAAAGQVRGLLPGASSVVVRTEEMMAGEMAIELVEGLRARGLRVGFVARGGYLWSRFVSADVGPGSQAARAAAFRERALCRAADVVIGPTEAMVADLAWRYSLPRDNTAVVPNWAAQHGVVRSAEEREAGTILCVGDLRLRKRVHLAIEAVARLKETGANCSLSIIGDGPERGALQDLARRYEISASFESSLAYDELIERMARCAIFLAPSSLECHPRTVLEAMSTGVAVVVADAPGLDAMVEHGVTGLRMTPEPEAFARAIEGLLGDPGWRDALGQAAIGSVLTQFTPRRVAATELALHQRAIELAGSARQAPVEAVSFEEELLGAGHERARAAWRRCLLSFASRVDGGDQFLRELADDISPRRRSDAA